MEFTREERLAHANAVIQAMSRHGRRFFHHEGRTASLGVDKAGKVFLVDEYSQKRVNVHKQGGWLDFSHGGTLRSIVEALRDYVLTGERLPGGWAGPARGYGVGDLWGYGLDALAAVRAELAGNPAVAFDGAPVDPCPKTRQEMQRDSEAAFARFGAALCGTILKPVE